MDENGVSSSTECRLVRVNTFAVYHYMTTEQPDSWIVETDCKRNVSFSVFLCRLLFATACIGIPYTTIVDVFCSLPLFTVSHPGWCVLQSLNDTRIHVDCGSTMSVLQWFIVKKCVICSLCYSYLVFVWSASVWTESQLVQRHPLSH